MATLTVTDALRGASIGSVLWTEDTSRTFVALERLVGRAAARKLLGNAGLVGIERMPATELAAVANVSLVLASRVVAARDFGASLARPPGPGVRSSADVIRHLPLGFETAETEMLLAVALAADMSVKATLLLGKGGDTSVSVRERDVFAPLMRMRAIAFVLVHNHPSGSPTPSAADIALTKRVAAGASVLGLEFVDHLVVAKNGTVSFRDHGLMPGHFGH